MWLNTLCMLWSALQVMLNAREVAFPSKPSVSAEAKDFIRRWAALGCAWGSIRDSRRRAWGGRRAAAAPCMPPAADGASAQHPVALLPRVARACSGLRGPCASASRACLPSPTLLPAPVQVSGLPPGGSRGCAPGCSTPLHVFQEARQGGQGELRDSGGACWGLSKRRRQRRLRLSDLFGWLDAASAPARRPSLS
jgi:hypothetical protein